MTREIEFGKNIRPMQPVYLDRLDLRIKQRVDENREIELSALRRAYPELGKIPYSTLRYRVISLAQENFIRLARSRRALICYSME
jgi:hypothetical protein